MQLQRRSSGLAVAAVASFALSVSCSDTSSLSEDGGKANAGAGGAGTAGTMSGAGTAGDGGTTSTGGTSAGTTSTGGVSGTSGSPGAGMGGTTSGEGGSNPAGAGGTAGAAGSGAGGTAGAAGSGAGGTSGTSGSGGSAGGGMMPTSGCGKAPGLMSGRASIDVGGKMREYILAIPNNYDQNKPYRLIFGWHPWGGSAQQIAQQGYFGLANASNGQAILVAPEGQDFQDNGLGWGNANGEDIAFLHAMVDRFSAELCIDQSRMFSTGFSFGAMFSFTLACTEMSMMRAMAPMAGNATTSGRCAEGTRSVATMAFIGVDDTLLSGHRQAVQIFVERNGCSEQTMPVTPSWCDGLNSQYQPCTCVQYQGCKDGYPVIECEYNAGHIFAPSAGATLWNFFSQF